MAISDYGLIGNCRTAALVSRQGSLDWCCFPRFDSPSYFSRLLDESGGHFRVAPREPFLSEQSYLEDTNVLETRFSTSQGTARLKDLFSVRGRETGSEVRGETLWPDQEILRILEASSGELAFELELLPRADYGRSGIRLAWIGDWGIQCSHGRKLLLLQTSLPRKAIRLEESGSGIAARAAFRLRAGERMIASLTYADEAPAVIPPIGTALDRLEETTRYWKGWSARCASFGPYSGLIRRSALALKLLNFAPSGAFVAAPTTSLPENRGGSRNWDYRFCWLRDASFTTRALLTLGYVDEAKSYLNWLLHSTRLSWPRLRVLYSVYGEARIGEQKADWLAGYEGSRPVRLGNEASAQIQLDVYGEVVDSFYSLAPYLEPIDRETRKMVIGFGKAVSELWDKPDQGIWELRASPKHYTHSKVMCWVVMDRLAKLASRYGWRLPYDAQGIATRIREAIESKSYDPELKAYTRAWGEPVLDASLLVMPLVGYCQATSPRFLSTQDAIARQLGQGAWVYRYPPGSDGITEREGAFILCSLWFSESLAKQGKTREAERWLDTVVDSLPSTGLASEEIDPASGALLGNHPQGFSHIGLIHAALAIQEARGHG